MHPLKGLYSLTRHTEISQPSDTPFRIMSTAAWSVPGPWRNRQFRPVGVRREKEGGGGEREGEEGGDGRGKEKGGRRAEVMEEGNVGEEIREEGGKGSEDRKSKQVRNEGGREG